MDNITYGGDGIGHLSSGKAIFVSKTIPGEKHLVEIKKEKKSYAYGQSVKLLNKAKNRIEPKCEIFDRCGGCQWQHIDYQGQKTLKEDILKDSLQRIGKIDNIRIEPIIGVDYPWFYRNKSTIPFEYKDEKIIAGFYKKGTHQVVDNHTCYIQHQLINRIKREVIRLLNKYDDITVYNEKTNQGLLRHLNIRVGVCTNQVLLTFITTDDDFPYLKEISNLLLNEIKELKGILRNINNKKTNVLLGKKTVLINGEDHIYDYIGERKYKIRPDTFFQINTIQTKKLYDVVNDYADIQKNKVIVDAFSGIGSIALYLNQDYKKMYGIESNKNAVKDSINNMKLNKLNNCEFINGDVTEEIPKLINKDEKPDIIIFDPPRSGLNEGIIESIIENKIKDVIYVSCNPTTLARDLKSLKDFYDILKVQPIDMFPQTYHLETVVKLRRKL
ncbi:MAG: 23S rRNA (uracil(1939)-C(5))-methyltransferase RlmD [Bacillota bacterium]